MFAWQRACGKLRALMAADLVIVFVLVFVHGLFAGSEIAVVSLRKTRLRQLVENGSSLAKAVEALRKNPERFLATVQIGITVIGTSLAAFGVATFRDLVRPVAAGMPQFVAQYSDEIAN